MRKRMKLTVVAGMLAVMTLGSVFTAEAAGPQMDAAGWWWQEDDGSRAVSTWKEVNGNKYYFGEDGYMYVDRWAEIPSYWTYPDPYTGSTITVEDTDICRFDASGALVTSGNWEGGAIMADGSLWVDDGPYCPEGYLTYWRDRTTIPVEPIGTWMTISDVDGVYMGALAWKYQMVKQWADTIADKGYGTFEMYFQLPANYADECPNPLMTRAFWMTCSEEWGDSGSWNFEWKVDANFVIHVVANYTSF